MHVGIHACELTSGDSKNNWGLGHAGMSSTNIFRGVQWLGAPIWWILMENPMKMDDEKWYLYELRRELLCRERWAAGIPWRMSGVDIFTKSSCLMPCPMFDGQIPHSTLKTRNLMNSNFWEVPTDSRAWGFQFSQSTNNQLGLKPPSYKQISI